MAVMYDQYGNEYEAIQEVSGGWVVKRVYERGDEIIIGDPVFVVCQLFDEPPHAKVDAEIMAKRAELSDIKQSIRDLKAEQKRIEAEGSAMLERIKQHAGLERLDQYLARKITHFVESHYGPPKIKTFDQALIQTDDYGRREKDMKLLCLFGSSGGDLAWYINRYRDGSGGWIEMTPCLSHEEAITIVRQIFDEHENDVLVDGSKLPSPEWAAAGEKFGFQMSKQYMEMLEQNQKKARDNEIEKLQKRLSELNPIVGVRRG